MKTKILSKGNYTLIHKDVEFKVIRLEELPSTEIAWYFQIGNSKVNDWYPTKKAAIAAAKNYIDNN